jgi:predicted methyltransferase
MARMNANPAVYNKVAMGVFSPPRKYEFAPAGSVDMVVTFRNIHNWIPLGGDNLKALFGSVYTSLKPGGVFGVVEHRLPANKTQDAEASSGYMHEKYVIGLAEAAGFKLAAKSEINANPKDTADHKNGVWALPPTYTNKDADRAKYQAIGESDRMTLKFVKP